MMKMNNGICCDTKTFYGSMRDIGAYGILAQANELAARGVMEASFEIQIAIPLEFDKSRLNAIRNHTKWAKELLKGQGFEIDALTISKRISGALKVPAVTITVMGMSEQKDLLADALLTARAGCDIILAGHIGTEGMLRIVGEKEAKLRERFTPAFIRQMKNYDKELSGIDMIQAAKELGATTIRQVSEGGIFAALWNLALEAEKGICLDLKKFAIRQETIEVCECYRLNPYQLTSHGSFLVLAEHGESITEKLKERGFEAAVIGSLTDNHDKVIHNGEDVRYIDRPAPDEINKIW